MIFKKRRARHTIRCPFCGNDFEPEDILFCDVLENQPEEASLYDSVYADFSEKFIQLNAVNATDSKGDPVTIKMEPRKQYYLHPWSDTNRKDKPPFHKPLQCKNGNAHKLYPARIKVRRNNGLSPRMEMSVPEPSDTATQQTEGSYINTLNSKPLFKSGANPSEEDHPQFPGDPIKTLSQKACPHCHCFLPDDIGLYPLHRVVVLGSTRAGKTTYMTLAAHQITSGTGMPAGLMKCTISEESRRYFDYLTQCMKFDVLEATRFENSNRIKVVFPLLFTVYPDSGSPFFLSIHDCPGEAMQNNTYLANFDELSDSQSVIMMLDPYQFIPNANEEGHCTINFNDTVNLFESNLQFFSDLRQIVFTLTKMDLIYGTDDDHYIKPKVYPNIDEKNLEDQHKDGINLTWIDDMSVQVSGAITTQLGYGHYETQICNLAKAQSNLGITSLCCSTLSWSNGNQCFVPIIEDRDGRRAYNMNGYRVLEPLLCVLAKCNLLPVKNK